MCILPSPVSALVGSLAYSFAAVVVLRACLLARGWESAHSTRECAEMLIMQDTVSIEERRRQDETCYN